MRRISAQDVQAKMNFTKMHGLGNDFIIVDNLSGEYNSFDFVPFAKQYCDRNFGIGADGVLIISESKKADANMRLINADGSEAEMCGNGIRCVARYIIDKGKASPIKVDTLAGIMVVEQSDDDYKVDMGIPKVVESKKIGKYEVTSVDMGNPHAVIFVDNFDFDWQVEGMDIENHESFPNRTNVEFVRVLSTEQLDVKVWERGAGATMACGTGACASLAAAVANKKSSSQALIKLRGGVLDIEIAGNKHIYMTGPADYVFAGKIDLE